MNTVTARGVVYVHSAPRALCPHVEWALARVLGITINFRWRAQPVLPGAKRAEYHWEGVPGDGALIASALRGWEHLRYEVTEDPSRGGDGGRWMHTPDLGIFFAQTDALGNTVIPENRIRQALESAGSDAFELHRELRVALGQAWDDELEAFRYAGEDSPITWMHKVS